MVIYLDESRVRTVAHMRAVLKNTHPLEFTAATDAAERCEWIAAVLKRLHYRFLNREDRGVVLQCLRHFSGFSRAQLTRVVGRALTGQPLRVPKGSPSNAFARRYTPEDLDALADVEREYGRLSGPAMVAVLRRMHQVYGDRRYVRLQNLPSSHLYNLRRSAEYRARHTVRTKTRSDRRFAAIATVAGPRGKPR